MYKTSEIPCSAVALLISSIPIAQMLKNITGFTMLLLHTCSRAAGFEWFQSTSAQHSHFAMLNIEIPKVCEAFAAKSKFALFLLQYMINLENVQVLFFDTHMPKNQGLAMF